jgi:hypothetical protein
MRHVSSYAEVLGDSTRGLDSIPQVRYTLGVEGSGYSPFPLIVRLGRATSSRSGGAAYGGAVGPGGSPMGRRMQPRNEKFFTLFSKAGSNVVESAAIFMEFVAAPHERWAELARAMPPPSTPATTPLRPTPGPILDKEGPECRGFGRWPDRGSERMTAKGVIQGGDACARWALGR